MVVSSTDAWNTPRCQLAVTQSTSYAVAPSQTPTTLETMPLHAFLSQCGIAEAIQVQINAEEICKCAGLPMPSFSITSADSVANDTSSY